MTPSPGYRIGYLHPWQQRAENQAFLSLRIAAERIGHELIEVRNSDEILAAQLDLVLAIASTQPKTTGVPTFGVIHEPRSRFLDNRQYFENLLTYDGYLTIMDTMVRFLQAFCAGVGRPAQIGYFYHHTAQRQFLATPIHRLAGSGALRLCYFGTNWDDRDRPLFRALSARPYTRIYGPEKSWAYLRRNYYGQVPFDGVSVQKVYAAFGVGLATLSKAHALDDIVSSRIFEIASVGAAAICPDIPWIRKHFGDTVYYYDGFQSTEAIVAQIDRAMAEIAADPHSAAARAQQARLIFEQKFAAEMLLRNAVRYFEEWRAAAGTPSAPANDPLIDVIVRVGGRPTATILRAIRSIEGQLAGRFRVLLVRYRPIDLAAVTQAQWSRIQTFAVVDCIGGGRAATLIAGLAAVRSALFAVLDDDDFWLPGHIAALLQRAAQCRPGRVFAYSGSLFVDEPPSGEAPTARERRQIRSLTAASGDIITISGTFVPCCFLASSALLRNIALDAWGLAIAEDNVLEWNLLDRADPVFTYRATACAVRGSQNASNFAAAETRQEDVLELLLRTHSMIDRIERKFRTGQSPVWSQLHRAMQQVTAARNRNFAGQPTTLVLEGTTVVRSLHERDDLELRELPLLGERVTLMGRSRFAEHGGAPALAVLPEAIAWAYGAIVRLDPAELFSDRQWVVLEFAPLAETVGAGLLNQTISDLQTQMEVPASALPVEAWLEVTDPAQASGVVVRNWSQPSRGEALLRRVWIVREPGETAEAAAWGAPLPTATRDRFQGA